MNSPILLENVHLYAPEDLGICSVVVQNGRIEGIYSQEEPPSIDERIDLQGALLGPGFIDVHTHGGNGGDFMTDSDAVATMARFFVSHGVTGFFPTTVTASVEDTVAAAERALGQIGRQSGGAQVLGVHLEGPMVSEKKLGAQSPEFRMDPEPDTLRRLIEVAQGFPSKLVTMAPELPGGLEAVKTFTEAGFIVSMGHTVADFETAKKAIDAGASHCTHTFNAMPSLHHRDPGVLGAVLTDDRVMIEFIADGIHVHPAVIELAISAKGVDSVILISDSISATGAADGHYMLGSVDVFVEGGEPRLESGALAGSTLTMDRAVMNVSKWSKVGMSGAWQMASTNPARHLGLHDRKGMVKAGFDADLAAMDGKTGQVLLTMVGGEIAFRQDA